jgi:hypothetical protein
VHLLKPVVAILLHLSKRPFSLAGFCLDSSDVELAVVAWIRLARLRLAPLVLTWKRVDNVEAAEVFAQELKAWKDSLVESPGRFTRLLDLLGDLGPGGSDSCWRARIMDPAVAH